MLVRDWQDGKQNIKGGPISVVGLLVIHSFQQMFAEPMGTARWEVPEFTGKSGVIFPLGNAQSLLHQKKVQLVFIQKLKKIKENKVLSTNT